MTFLIAYIIIGFMLVLGGMIRFKQWPSNLDTFTLSVGMMLLWPIWLVRDILSYFN